MTVRVVAVSVPNSRHGFWRVWPSGGAWLSGGWGLVALKARGDNWREALAEWVKAREATLAAYVDEAASLHR